MNDNTEEPTLPKKPPLKTVPKFLEKNKNKDKSRNNSEQEEQKD